MTKRKRNLLIIEDRTNWLNDFERIIKLFDPEVKFKKHSDFRLFIQEYGSPEDFNNFEICIIDLELGSGFKGQRSDEYGRERVLPHIQKLAPWLPTICLSSHIQRDIDLLPDLSFSDFDLLCDKQTITEEDEVSEDDLPSLIPSPDFNPDFWKNIILQIQLKRVSKLKGESITITLNLLTDNNKEIIYSEKSKELASNYNLNTFGEGIKLVGFPGDKISVDLVSQGHSGENVFKISVYNNGKKSGIWLLKVGNKPSKMWKEIKNHREIFHSGVHRLLIPPLYHNNPIYWQNTMFIVYSFIDDATTAFEISNNQGIEVLYEPWKILCDLLYSVNNAHVKPINPIEILNQLFNGLESDFMLKVRGKYGSKTMEITEGLVHGDLHLKNIMIENGKMLLIDFARSQNSPIVLDLAKLCVDVLAFMNFDLEIIPKLDLVELKKTTLGGIIQAFDTIFDSAKDNILLFNLFLATYAKTYCKYDDVDENVKHHFLRMIDDSFCD